MPGSMKGVQRLPKELSQTVVNSMRMVECFSESEELGITELAAAIGIGKTATARLVSSLAEFGYLWQNPRTKKYRLGLKFMYWGSLVAERNEIVQLADPYLRALAKEFQLTTHLAIRENHAALIVSKVTMGPMVYMDSRVGTTLPIHASAVGKCLIAFSQPAAQKEFLSCVELLRFTEKTIVDKNQFWMECQQVRQQGYAFDIEESNLGLSCLAVPLLDSRGRPIAAISTSGQTQFVLKNQASILDRLHQIQQELTPYL